MGDPLRMADEIAASIARQYAALEETERRAPRLRGEQRPCGVCKGSSPPREPTDAMLDALTSDWWPHVTRREIWYAMYDAWAVSVLSCQACGGRGYVIEPRLEGDHDEL